MSDSHWKASRTAAVAAALLLATPAALAQSEPESGNGPAPAGQLTRAPEVTEFVQAEYPPAALADGLTAEVVLTVTIEADGTVSAAEVSEPAGHGFDAAAIDALRRFRFRPAEVDGAPAAVQILYRYAFTLEERVEEVAAPAEIPVGRLTGELREAGTRRPIVAAVVRLRAGDAALEAITDPAGSFSFEAVPAGDVVVSVDDEQYEAVDDTEAVEAGKVTEVRYYLERTGFGTDGVTVVARRPRKEVVRRTLTISEIRTIPGTNGDALKVIQNMPGAARTFGNGGAIVLRGGGDSYATVNGQPVPAAFHFGGLRSTVSSELIESLEVTPGNYGVEYGRGTGGIVEVRTRRPATDGLHGHVQADVFDASLFVEGPVDDVSSFALGVRRSYIDAILPLALPDEAMETFSMAPRYLDWQAVYDRRSGDHDLRVTLFGASDSMELLLKAPPESDPTLRGDLALDLDWGAAQLEWTWRISPTLSNRVLVGSMLVDQHQAIGESLSMEFGGWMTTLRDTVEADLNDSLRLRAGLDAEVTRLDVDVTSPAPPREGAPMGPMSTMTLRHTDVVKILVDPAAFAELHVKLGDLLVIPGVRAEYFSMADDWAVLPRLTARWKALEGTTLKAGVGLFSESPQPVDMDVAFGNPELDLVRALHVSAGAEQRLADAVTLDVTGFYKSMWDMVTPVDDPQTRLANQGDGRAYGLEVLLRHDAGERLYGWLAYTLMRSERQDAPGAAWRPFDLDQTHNLTAVLQYKLTTTWEAGLRWRYVTGNPHTPWARATFDSDADAWSPVAGASNSQRLPAFHQLDVRVDKHFVFDTWRLTAYLDVQNAYNRANAEGYAYNHDYTERTTSSGLPVIPSFGVRGEM